jgi:hypothetical protein
MSEAGTAQSAGSRVWGPNADKATWYLRGNGKGHPIAGHRGPRGGAEVLLYSFSTSALGGGGWYLCGGNQNIPDWFRHPYSSCGSAKHQYMVGLPCLMSQCAKLHVAGWRWAVLTSVCFFFLFFITSVRNILEYPRIV